MNTGDIISMPNTRAAELVQVVVRVPRKEREEVKAALKGAGMTLQDALSQVWDDLREDVDAGRFVLRARSLERRRVS